MPNHFQMPSTDQTKPALYDEVRCFCVEMIQRWQWYSCSVLGSAGFAYWQGSGGLIPAWTLWLIAISGLVVAWREQFRAVADLRGRAIDERDRVLLDCADRISAGETVLQALQSSKADELETNEDLCQILDQLAKAGHSNPFSEGGDFCGYGRGQELYALRELRLKGIAHTEVYEYVLAQYLSAEAKR
jgi:hypothetical protein